MNTRDALESAVRRFPDDDTPRHILADYIAETVGESESQIVRHGIPCTAVEPIEQGQIVELVEWSAEPERRLVMLWRGGEKFGRAVNDAAEGERVGVY